MHTGASLVAPRTAAVPSRPLLRALVRACALNSVFCGRRATTKGEQRWDAARINVVVVVVVRANATAPLSPPGLMAGEAEGRSPRVSVVASISCLRRPAADCCSALTVGTGAWPSGSALRPLRTLVVAASS